MVHLFAGAWPVGPRRPARSGHHACHRDGRRGGDNCASAAQHRCL